MKAHNVVKVPIEHLRIYSLKHNMQFTGASSSKPVKRNYQRTGKYFLEILIIRNNNEWFRTGNKVIRKRDFHY